MKVDPVAGDLYRAGGLVNTANREVDCSIRLLRLRLAVKHADRAARELRLWIAQVEEQVAKEAR